MRKKIERMQQEVNEFMDYVRHELSRGLGDWEQRLNTAIVRARPGDLVKHEHISKSTNQQITKSPNDL